ncbi:MAG: hypothetical protein AB1815_05870 [Bacillota bacterium]
MDETKHIKETLPPPIQAAIERREAARWANWRKEAGDRRETVHAINPFAAVCYALDFLQYFLDHALAIFARLWNVLVVVFFLGFVYSLMTVAYPDTKLPGSEVVLGVYEALWEGVKQLTLHLIDQFLK